MFAVPLILSSFVTQKQKRNISSATRTSASCLSSFPYHKTWLVLLPSYSLPLHSCTHPSGTDHSCFFNSSHLYTLQPHCLPAISPICTHTPSCSCLFLFPFSPVHIFIFQAHPQLPPGSHHITQCPETRLISSVNLPITIANKKGLRVDPWCFTYVSATPDFLILCHNSFLGTLP